MAKYSVRERYRTADRGARRVSPGVTGCISLAVLGERGTIYTPHITEASSTSPIRYDIGHIPFTGGKTGYRIGSPVLRNPPKMASIFEQYFRELQIFRSFLKIFQYLREFRCHPCQPITRPHTFAHVPISAAICSTPRSKPQRFRLRVLPKSTP